MSAQYIPSYVFRAMAVYTDEVPLLHGVIFTLSETIAPDGYAHLMFICDDHEETAQFDFYNDEEMASAIAEIVAADLNVALDNTDDFSAELDAMTDAEWDELYAALAEEWED